MVPTRRNEDMENFLKRRKQASNTKKSLIAKTKKSNVQNALQMRVSNLKLTKKFLEGSPITLNLLKPQSLEQEGRLATGHKKSTDHRILENYEAAPPKSPQHRYPHTRKNQSSLDVVKLKNSTKKNQLEEGKGKI